MSTALSKKESARDLTLEIGKIAAKPENNGLSADVIKKAKEIIEANLKLLEELHGRLDGTPGNR